MKILSDLSPKSVFAFFEDICSIPHGSGNCEKISRYCVDFAEKRGFLVTRDKNYNVIIKKCGTKGYENHPPVILQGHLDMVCEKDKDCKIDFENDGLKLCVDGDYIYADGTTLGGDDGIAVAMILAVLDSDDLVHPPIEAVFTTDEETSMGGAAALDTSSLKGKALINIDSEDEGVLTVSCAGGLRAEIDLPMKRDVGECRCPYYHITVSGLHGGHSGQMIDKGFLNADIILGKFLKTLDKFKLCKISGGLKDNAIPSSAECVIRTSCDPTAKALDFVRQNKCAADPDLTITVDLTGACDSFDFESSQRAVNFLCETPNGVQSMSRDIDGLVQTSLNLGILSSDENNIHFSFSLRSSLENEKHELSKKLRKTAEKFSAKYREHGNYPAWEYKKESPLRDTMTSVYEKMTGQKPQILAIHAGLECGLFSAKIPGLDAVSFGPNMLDIHTARERLSISSVERTYKFLLEILREM